MPQEIRLWEVKDNGLMEIPRGKLSFEEHLEEWLENDISIISDDLLVIGRQVKTAFGKYIDLLCVKRNGDLVIVELKRDKAPREVIAQILEYASWVDDLSYDEIVDIANNYLKNKEGITFEEAFERKFEEPLPDVLNESHEMLIVASDLDNQGERVIRYLSEYGIRINAVTFNYFKKGEQELVARVMLIPKSAEEVRKTKRGPPPTEEELRKIAQDNGVGELYSILFKELELLFDDWRTTKSSVAFTGRQNGSMITIFSILPDQSSQQDGLKFQVYLKRFAKYFNISEAEAENMLPQKQREGRLHKNAPQGDIGYEGFFKNREEIEKFVNKLRELKTKVMA
ncbi:MAG: endonuclease NucS [Candidatus Bathyarchaeia archaeon]